MKLIYLAQPYTHPDESVREARFQMARYWTGKLIHNGAVFSPIVHGRTIEAKIDYIDNPHKFWMSQCIPILRRSDEMFVLPIRGWRESRGLKDELAICKMLDIPVIFILALSLSHKSFASECDFPTDKEFEKNNWEFLYV